MPNTTVQLRNKATGDIQTFALSDFQSAIDSGKYEAYEGSNIPTDLYGTTTPVKPDIAPATLDAQPSIDPNIIGAEQTREAQREALSTFDDKALTFAEGITDALSFGLVKERGPLADIRREVNPGAAFSGELSGIALGLFTGAGQAKLAQLGEKAGRTAAKAIFKSSESVAARAGTRALSEAGANAAITAAQSYGSAAWDSILANKPIAAEAIAHEVGFAGLLGGGFGAIGGALSKVTKPLAADIKAGMELQKFGDDAASTFDTSINELRHALRQQETRLGVLKQAREDKLIPGDMIHVRADKLVEAQKAEQKLINLGNASSALKANPRSAFKWQRALEDFNIAVKELDDSMTPRLNEAMGRLNKQELGKPVQGPIRPSGDDVVTPGVTSEEVIGLNERMAKSPALRDQYEEMFGRKWEAVPDSSGNKIPTIDDVDDLVGGKITPTSELATGIGTKSAERVNLDLDPINPNPNPDLQYWPPFIHPNPNPSIQYKPDIIPSVESFDDVASRLKASAGSKTSVNKEGAITDIAKSDVTNVIGKDPVTGVYTPPPFVRGQGVTKWHYKKVSDTQILEESLAHPELEGDAILASLKNVTKDLDLQKHAKFRALLDDWFDDSKRVFHGTPEGRAVQIIDQKLKDLNATGRLDSVNAIDIARSSGLGESTTELGARFQQAWGLNQLYKDTVKASKAPSSQLMDDEGNIVSAAMAKKGVVGRVLHHVQRRVGGRAGSAIAGALIGNELAGGGTGYHIGAMLATGYLGFGGRIAGTIGRINSKIVKTSEFLLSGRKPTIATQAINLATNKDWSYSERGPISNPVERIQEIQHVAMHPELIQEQLLNNAGDLANINPELVDLLTKVTQGRMISLSIRAPKFVWDKFGQPLPPPEGALRRFIEYENAVNDLDGTLNAINKGVISKDAADGFREGWSVFHKQLVAPLLSDPKKLQSLNLESRRNIETLTGIDLSGLTDGNYLIREQESWALANTATPMNGPTAGKPQSFKINQMPATKPTATQSTNGRAPGN